MADDDRIDDSSVNDDTRTCPYGLTIAESNDTLSRQRLNLSVVDPTTLCCGVMNRSINRMTMIDLNRIKSNTGRSESVSAAVSDESLARATAGVPWTTAVIYSERSLSGVRRQRREK